MATTTINKAEVEKFSKIADEWWDPNGKFKPLHQINPVRLRFVKNIICQHFKIDVETAQPLGKLNILDIGCGGGLVSLPMARLGASMTAIDASEKNIKTAQNYAERQKIKVDFQCKTAEDLAVTKQQFDVVLNLEVIEHVDNIELYLRSCAQLIKPGGTMILSTINRTMKAYMLAIIGAEYVLGWLPKGTHQYEKFLQPAEINQLCEHNKLKLQEMKGLEFDLLANKWHLTNNVDVNYLMLITK